MGHKKCASLPFLSLPDPAEDTFFYERQLTDKGFAAIAGVDEAGRGPLAGPVVAGCVVLTADCEYQLYDDSKKLSPLKRSSLYDKLLASSAAVGLGIATVAEIDEINILQASLLAMKRAVSDCFTQANVQPDFLLVDGKFPVPIVVDQQPLIKGESKSASIAAASIIAKVSRDRMMAAYHKKYPEYNFIQHQGYPTKAHKAAVAEHGPCAIHRKTFKGVREFVSV